MEIYRRAARTLGCHADGDNLINVQAFLLAGLYKGQLGEVRESLNWINIAGRVCQNLLRRYNLTDLSNFTAHPSAEDVLKKRQSRVQEPIHNLILLATWTSIQLESDILAELPLPSSGIQAYEDVIPWPLQMPGIKAYKRLLPELGRQAYDCSGENILVSSTRHNCGCASAWIEFRPNCMEMRASHHHPRMSGKLYENISSCCVLGGIVCPLLWDGMTMIHLRKIFLQQGYGQNTGEHTM